MTLTATVSEISGAGIPSGTVSFADVISGSPIPLGSAALASGVAQLVVPDLSPGPHQLVASYGGSATDNASSSPPLAVNSHEPVDPRVETTTTVDVSPSVIASGDSATITATIDQIGASASPPGGAVTFTSTSVFGRMSSSARPTSALPRTA